jgi:hypothetical protein
MKSTMKALVLGAALLAVMPASAAQWEKNLAQLERDTSKRVRYADTNAMRVLKTSGLDCANYASEGAPPDRLIVFDTLLRMQIQQIMGLLGMDKTAEYPFFKAKTTKAGSVIVEVFVRQPSGEVLSQVDVVIGKSSYQWNGVSRANKLGACVGLMGQYFE